MDIIHDANPSAPDWSTLDFEVTCPRCANNLKMLAQPRCPECELQSPCRAVRQFAAPPDAAAPFFACCYCSMKPGNFIDIVRFARHDVRMNSLSLAPLSLSFSLSL